MSLELLFRSVTKERRARKQNNGTTDSVVSEPRLDDLVLDVYYKLMGFGSVLGFDPDSLWRGAVPRRSVSSSVSDGNIRFSTCVARGPTVRTLPSCCIPQRAANGTEGSSRATPLVYCSVV
ncbi:hypothetical protein NC653_026473 [Populus alba x Populus x berolinensis]|uniref:Uncharacterized protein n=1 Tax=Populus alba x Populus x berolinensis TaxID=444605 RepID=A0AAD6MDZ7_9ROSI|nr:hypothetical protein NC653_026473 [Populus alba x Populus x berolinensis]